MVPGLSLSFEVPFKNCTFKFDPITLTKQKAYHKTGEDIIGISIHMGRHYKGNASACRSYPGLCQLIQKLWQFHPATLFCVTKVVTSIPLNLANDCGFLLSRLFRNVVLLAQ